MLNVICVQTGNYLGRGFEYVHKLHQQVKANLTVRHRFIVMTDDFPANYRGMEIIRAVHQGWWQKLAMFERGQFSDRCLFLDLDTLILANIDHVARYDGPFATLADFWRKRGLGPAVMLWTPNPLSEALYEDWKAAGFPKDGNGDQTWIENRLQPDILQDLFPGEFVSYKEHCTNGRRQWRGDVSDQVAPPVQARIVCFHGRPRVHEVGGWVPHVWSAQVMEAA